MSNNAAQLITSLKSLKLSGMADTVELRLMEAQNNSLAFSEFLSMLLTDETQARANRKLERLLQHAHADSSKTLESFDFSFNPSINAAMIRELATCHFMDKGENVFFLGPTGTGKTHLAKAIAHMACRKHLNVEYFNFQELLRLLAQADLASSLDKRLNSLIKSDLLILDDFAFKKIDQQSAEYLYAIVDARYPSKSILITSNRSISDWQAIFPDPIMANALMDRLAHNAHQILIKGESYRKKLAPSKLDSDNNMGYTSIR